MPEPTTPMRKPKRFLTAEQKYEIWLKLLTGELTSQQGANLKVPQALCTVLDELTET